MPSYIVVGAARGIGFEFVRQLSATSTNQVVALIRSQKTADALNELVSKQSNIHVVEADIYSPESLSAAVAKVEKITGGALDVLIHNAYSAGTEAMFLTASQFTGKESELNLELADTIKANVMGPILSINAFLPLIRKGNEKKLVYITSGAGDVDMTRISRLSAQIGYSASKAGGNIVMAKYAGELAEEGIKTVSISPGWVETPATEGLFQDQAVYDYLFNAFKRIQPNVTGMIKAEVSVKAQLEVIAKLDEKSSGSFVSHHGNTQWVD